MTRIVAKPEQPATYSSQEERFNIASHFFGMLMSVVGLALLLIQAMRQENAVGTMSFAVFGSSLVILYAASTWYHKATDPGQRQRRRILDHAAIYILIAGTYTPFALVTLDGSVGNTIFIVTWSMAAAGVTLKLFFTGSFKLLSTLIYVAMGWLIIFAFEPLRTNLPAAGLYWLAAGGIAYTAGAILYGFKSLKFSHAIFHVFVLIGSFCHFVSIYNYVLPGPAA